MADPNISGQDYVPVVPIPKRQPRPTPSPTPAAVGIDAGPAYPVPSYDPAAITPGIADYSNGVDQAAPPVRGRKNVNMRPAFAIPKRSMAVKRIELTARGNLQVDVPVPSRVLDWGELKSGWEVQNMRYTAATCDPDDFAPLGYTLRPSDLGRQTELFIVMTMYNENEVLFTRSMHAVITNIKHFLTRERSDTWGPDAWKKIVVCIVSDGRKNINQRTLNLLRVMGCYQDGVPKSDVDGKPVTAHIFEYTTQVDIDTNLSVKPSVPVQVLFCLKEQNAKKINSHRWFFNAFCPILKPNVTILIDVGTRPLDDSLYYLWKVFDKHPNVGGACGEIRADVGPFWVDAWKNPLVAAQNFEYKVSNILDKPLESSFGYISVLPGAFSAYRYRALTNYAPNKGPLASYFKGEKLHKGEIDGGVFQNNMYLAEDRILCFELVAKPDEAWLLRYEKNAVGETDVPDGIPELVSQRRRWLNGSQFAAFYALSRWMQVWKSDHNIIRKFMFMLEGIYQFLVLLFAWFSVANFFLAFYFTLSMQVFPGNPSNCTPEQASELMLMFGCSGYIVAPVFLWVYVVLLIAQFILSLGNRPQGSKNLYRIIMVLWAGIMGLTLAMLAYSMYATITKAIEAISSTGSNFNSVWNYLTSPNGKNFQALLIGFMSTFGLWIISGILYLDPWHIINSMLQYLFLQPFWVNVMQVYAMCNTHDVTWGTKGDNSGKHDLGSANVKPSDATGGKKVVELELPDAGKADEANTQYLAALNVLKEGPQKEKEATVSAAVAKEDDFKKFRTIMVLVWVLSNLALCAVMTQPVIQQLMDVAFNGPVPTDFQNAPPRINPYLAFLFYATAFFAVIKFIGCVWYLIFQQLLDWKTRSQNLGNTMAQRPGFNA